MNEQNKQDIIRLVENSRDAFVGSVDDSGHPNVKTMFKRKYEGLRTFWFSTNTSAFRTGQWQKNPKACIYFADPVGFYGLLLTGTMKVYSDNETKLRFWETGDEQYYSLGPTDPDYCMLCFTADKGNYYHGLERQLFDVAGFGR